MTKRIVSFCLSVILLVSMMSVCGLVLPVMAAEGYGAYTYDAGGVYVNNRDGVAGAAGTSAAPVPTIDEAITIVEDPTYTGPRVITVALCASAASTQFSADLTNGLTRYYEEPITLRHTSAGSELRFNGAELILAGPMVFENMVLARRNGGTLNIITNGYDFTVTNTVTVAANTTASISHGYSKYWRNGAASLDLNKDLNLTLNGGKFSEVVIGNYGSTTGQVKYNSANIMIDGATVTTLHLGSKSGVSGQRNNWFKNDFNLVVNNCGSSMTINHSHIQNGLAVQGSVQMLFNNETYNNLVDAGDCGTCASTIADTSPIPHFYGSVSSNNFAYALKGQWVLKGAVYGGSYLEKTATVGTYRVRGGKIATATSADGSKSYTSELGELVIPEAGDYTVTYSEPVLDYVNGVYVDNQNGSVGATGVVEDPVSTITEAIDIIEGDGYSGARVITVTTCAFAATTQFDLDLTGGRTRYYEEPITLRHATGGAIRFTGSGTDLILAGPMVFENMTVEKRSGNTLGGTLNIITNGYDFSVESNVAVAVNTTASIYHGYSTYWRNGVASLDLDKDLNLTLKGGTFAEVVIGNYGTATGQVKYNNANIVIDGATVTTLHLGSKSGVSGQRNNWFKNDFNLIVNNCGSSMTINHSHMQNGYAVQGSVQMLFNNEAYNNLVDAGDCGTCASTIADTSPIPHFYGSVSSNNFAYAMKGQWVLKGAKVDGCYLEKTATLGTFTVYGDKQAVATSADGSKTYKSKNGELVIPEAGDYTVTYSEPVLDYVSGVYVDNQNGTAGAMGTIDDPVLTITEAIDIIEGDGYSGVRVITVTTCAFAATTQFGLDFTSNRTRYYEEPITLRHATGGTIRFTGTGDDLILAGPMVFENMTVEKRKNNTLGGTLNIITNGYDFTVESNVTVAANTTASIYHGYSTYWRNGAAVDSVTLDKDLNLTLKGGTFAAVNIGNYGSTTKQVKYNSANILIDGAKVSTLHLASNATAGMGQRHNWFTKDFNLVVNDCGDAMTITHAHQYNGLAVEGNLQMVFNNGTYHKLVDAGDCAVCAGTIADTSPVPHFYGSVSTNNLGYVLGDQWIVKNDGAPMGLTATPGTFTVSAVKPATAENTDKTVKTTSVNGTISMPAGEYVMSYYQVIYVDPVDGNDQNDGLSASTALQSIPAAVEKINALNLTGEERTVYLVASSWSANVYADFSACTPYTDPIIIRSKNASDIIQLDSTEIVLCGPITFEHTQVGCTVNSGVSFFANGYALKFAETVKLNSKTTLYAGVVNKNVNISAGKGEVIADKTLNGGTMHLEFLGGATATGSIPYVSLGGYDNKNDPKIYVFDSAYLLIDSPNVNVSDLFMGYHYSYNTAAYSDQYCPNTRVTGNVTVVIHNAVLPKITCGSMGNAMAIEGNLQLVFNNGVGDALTIPDYRTIKAAALAGGQWVLRSAAVAGSYLETTDTVGTYRVVGNKVAVATAGGKTYRSVNGVLTVPAGDYTVTYEELAYSFTNDTLTALTDVTLDVSAIAPVQDGNRILLGWTTIDGTPVANITNVTLAAGETLKAVYGDFNVSYESGNADFFIEGVQMRATDDQGLRFIITKSTSFNSRFEAVSGVKYGYVLLPKQLLNGELTVDTPTAVKKDNSENGFKHFDESGERYTVCLTKIPAAYYNTVYVARGYVTYTDMNGVKRTVYGEQLPCSLFEAASLTTTADDARETNDPLKLPAEQRDRVLAVVSSYLNDAQNKQTEKVTNWADSLQPAAGGQIWYVSQNGSDEADGSTTGTAWKTIARLNKALSDGTIRSGDVVLFERGGVYRVAADGTYSEDGYGIQAYRVSGVKYGAYGSGAKPVINGSYRDYTDGNVWNAAGNKKWEIRLTDDVLNSADAGVIVLGNGAQTPVVGNRKVTEAELTKNFDFYYDYDLKKVILYYDGANLNTAFDYIEVGTDIRLFDISTADSTGEWVSDIVVENLDFRYTGGFAIRGSDNRNITIQGCEFSYIGGSYHNDSDRQMENVVRYGNAVEFMQSAYNVTVKNCLIQEVYDSGVTFQGGDAATMTVDGFVMEDCVVKNCGLGSFEYWMGSAGTAYNVVVKNNYMIGAGCGWGGEQRPDRSTSAHIRTDGTNRIYNFVIANNVFNGSNYLADDQAQIYAFVSGYNLFPELIRNVYVDSQEANLGYQRYYWKNAKHDEYDYDSGVRETLKTNFGESAPIVLFTESIIVDPKVDNEESTTNPPLVVDPEF